MKRESLDESRLHRFYESKMIVGPSLMKAYLTMLRVHIFLIFLFVLMFSSFAQTADFFVLNQIRSHPEKKKQFEQLLQEIVKEEFQISSDSSDATRVLSSVMSQNPFPHFITLKKQNETRGCMGNLMTQKKTLKEEIQKNFHLALTQDPRHRPVYREEIPQLEMYISEVLRPRPIKRLSEISPSKDGLLIRSGSKEAVVLAGEAKTLRYLLAFAKAKAGIQKTDS
ncbi:MAG: AMMECR1 domain-containing protein, partial [Deltaproteobacteria bacterium]|nr:AMMECR1 domain-containing protein [Deltaproteobacteria bacterium]